ncbi:MAG: hypothetical protein ACYTG6_03030 [Planctomycetota bacterium]|jgi:hypothetical protein
MAARAVQEEIIGRGRSGVVYRHRDAAGRAAVRKVFDSHGLSKVVQILFLGAPNPYAWDEHAIRSAVLSRQILADLVPYWFGDGVGVADAFDHAWSEEHRAFELRAAFVRGEHVPLRHPLRPDTRREIRSLVHGVMKPLQRRLHEAGFVGLVWQAGRGNPVARNNFLLERQEGGKDRWVWIDLESGVPALFPLNPFELLQFYLPRAVEFRRPLFDDVDARRLRRYLRIHREGLLETCGARRYAEILQSAELLAFHQLRWKSRSRVERSVNYQLRKGRIDAAEAAWYARRPGRWYAREFGRLAVSLVRKAGAALRGLARRIRDFPYRRTLAGLWKYFTSQAFREEVAQGYVSGRVEAWLQRGQMSAADAEVLMAGVDREEGGVYLTDFGVHLSIKPLVKPLQYWVLPALFAAGVIDAVTLGVLIVAGGPLVRTLYTGWRTLQATVRRRERPWIALGVGTLPMIGNLAYPLQILYSGTEGGSRVAQFLLYDILGAMGRRIPIWGGPDTGSEHAFNAVAGVVARSRDRG